MGSVSEGHKKRLESDLKSFFFGICLYLNKKAIVPDAHSR